MFEFLGDIERLLADLYPYRVPLTIGTLVVLAAGAWIAWRIGWLGRTWRFAIARPLASFAVVVAVIAVTLPVGWYVASPLWTRTELIEASPLELAAQAAEPTATPDAPADAVPGVPSPPAEAAGEPEGEQPMAADAPVDGADEAAEFMPGVVLSGEWMGADAFHFAEGEALIIETEPGRYVLRVEDFSVRNGPDLFMYLSPDPDGYAEGGLNLGELRATDGAFNYEIPEGTDLSAFQSVVVWCERFAVLFATATLMEA